jgi:hypothetical protein
MQVERQHVRRRAVAGPLLEARLDAGVAAAENLALVQPDRLPQAVLADVAYQVPELGAADVHEREEVGGRVGVELCCGLQAQDGRVGLGRARGVHHPVLASSGRLRQAGAAAFITPPASARPYT